MPDELDQLYNEPLQAAFRRNLRAEDGAKAALFDGLQEDFAELLAFVSAAGSPAEANQRLDDGLVELERATVERIESAKDSGRQAITEGHAEGYAAAAAATGVSVPDWSPSAAGTSAFEKAPFAGAGGSGGGASTTADFVAGAFDEEVGYFKQDLKFIRKYVDEDEYAKAVAQVLARGNQDVKRRLLRRGIDLDDIDTDALQEQAARVFQNTKTMGSPDIRGILKELEPEEVAARQPQLWQRIQTNGTDQLSRVMDEVAKDLAVDSPAITAVTWTLSTRHGSLDSSPDECDTLAGADPYGLGAGAYPPEKTPSHPHPSCECRITAQTRPPEQWGQPTPDPPQDYQLTDRAIRQQLESTRARMGDVGRTITDTHVQRVRERVYAVLDEVDASPRG